MARNEEKALTLFNKWHTFKKEFHENPLNKRPLAASECQSLPDAEKARRGLLKEISKKIALVQNASLGESRLRELNDEINKHLRQKHFYEARIRELGGGDFRGARATQLFEVEGRELPGAPGYRYYGAAKDLPGVRELFAEHDGALAQQSSRRQQQRSRAEIHRGITPDYFGFRDEEDGVLLPKEAAVEREHEQAVLREEALKRRRLAEDARRSGGVFGRAELEAAEAERKEDEIETAILMALLGVDNASGEAAAAPSEEHQQQRGARVRQLALPSAEEVRAAIVEERKRRLLEQML